MLCCMQSLYYMCESDILPCDTPLLTILSAQEANVAFLAELHDRSIKLQDLKRFISITSNFMAHRSV